MEDLFAPAADLPVKVLLFVHILSGMLGFAGGVIALVARKGGRWHRRGGSAFFAGMLAAAAAALAIASLPGHRSPLLFSIGCFTAYLLLSGRRALAYSRWGPGRSLFYDRTLAILMVGVGGFMWFWAFTRAPGGSSVILMVFGGIGIALAVRDLRVLRHPDRLSALSLRLHLSKMLGAFIAATTAFLLTNELLPGLWAWLSPTVVGTALILYWSRKVRRGISTRDQWQQHN